MGKNVSRILWFVVLLLFFLYHIAMKKTTRIEDVFPIETGDIPFL